jgi:hypothetical protein
VLLDVPEQLQRAWLRLLAIWLGRFLAGQRIHPGHILFQQVVFIQVVAIKGRPVGCAILLSDRWTRATPEARAALEAYIGQYKADLRPYLRGGVYLNFMMGNEARRRTRDAYLPSSYRRLLELKAKYDPDNMFRYSYQLVELALNEV